MTADALFSLGGFLELMDDPELDEATREAFLAQMREQVDRLTKLATDLLDLSRLDAGRLLVAREPIELSELADGVAAEFRGRAGDRAIEVVADDPVPAQGDAERVLRSAGSCSRTRSCTSDDNGTDLDRRRRRRAR
jgi:signal transduction histidine kinase